MNTTIKRKLQPVGFCAVAAVLMASCGLALGDDINPPPYRGGPLSVYTHWTPDASGLLSLDQFSSVDDNDPSTYLTPFPPTVGMDPATGIYDFRIPNFVDEMPIKYLRIQMTWTGTTQPPLSLSSQGLDGGNIVPGVITLASNPLVFTQPDGGYQYFDFEYSPNPDWEQIHVQLPPDALLTQVVIDSISTIPEPASAGLLALGSLIALRRRSKGTAVNSSHKQA